MKSKPWFLRLVIVGCLIFSSSLLQAGQAKFSIIPTDNSITAFLMPINFTETVRYQVTNQTNTSRTLTLVPIQGVSQTATGMGVCPSPFTLAPGQSCTLVLVITGSQVSSSGISSGPVICKTRGPNDNRPDAFLCSQPSKANTLAVSVTTTIGQFAYVANQLSNTISFCQVNPATGFLSHCMITASGLGGPEGVGFNPTKTFFYIANPLTNSISICPVNALTGALGSCSDAGGSGFNLPDAVAFSPDGTIFYTSNFGGGGSVSACLVSQATGLLSNCVTNTSPTFSSPGDMTVNASGTIAYVVNRTANTTSVCRVSSQMVDACDDSSGSLFNGPEGITINPAGLKAYITNAGNRSVVVCDIRQDSAGLLENCTLTEGEFDGTGNLGLNNLGTLAYVPNQLRQEVFVCNVARGTGELSGCIRSRGADFVGPAGVVLN